MRTVADLEAAEAATSAYPPSLQPQHGSARRTLAHERLEGVERASVSLGHQLNGAIIAVGDPAGKIEVVCRTRHEDAKADALDAAMDGHFQPFLRGAVAIDQAARLT